MPDPRPVIGITTGSRYEPKNSDPFGTVALRREYVDRVREAGGVPVILPPGSDGAALAAVVDGLLMSGGNDLDPALWGDKPHRQNSVEDPRRFELERAIWQYAPRGMPVLGVCYGCQCLNVLHGGSLAQHLPDLLGHDNHSGDSVQTYRVEPGTKLAGAVGGSASGKSNHHQAVGTLGVGLRVSATHEDGTVEAVETADSRWVVGVQWHPERSDAETTTKLFAAFVAEATSFKRERHTCGTW